MNAADFGFQLHGTALRLTTRAPEAPGPGPSLASSSRAVGARQAYYVPAGTYPKDVAAAASFPCKGFGPPPGPPRPAPARAPAPRPQPSTRTPNATASARPSTARPRPTATTATSRRYSPRDEMAAVPARSHPNNANARDGSCPPPVPTAWGSSPRIAESTVPNGDAGPIPAAPTPPASRLVDSMTRLVLEDASPSPSPLPPEPLDFRGAPAPSPPASASYSAALSSLPTPPLSPQPPDLVHSSSSSLHHEPRPEPDGDVLRKRRPISVRVPPARTKTASTSTSGTPSTRPPPSRYYDHKSVKRQTCRKNTEQWAMETIVIRRLRYLVDNLDELGEEHLPLLNTLEASGIRPDQLQLYFPHVRTVHDLKVHLVNLLSDRDPDHVRPHRAVARNLAGSERPPGPPAAPPVGATAGPSRRNHGHTKPAATPLEVLKIVEQFYPIPRSAAAAASTAAKSVPGSDARLGLVTATTMGASTGGLGAAAATSVGGLHGGAAAARHRLAG